MKRENAYKQFKILSLDGSQIIRLGKNGYDVHTPDGGIDFSRFNGYLDESLETIQLEKVYDRHKKENGEFAEGFRFYPRSSPKGDPYTLSLINVSFDGAVKTYTEYKTGTGRLFVLGGVERSAVDRGLNDHIWIEKDGNGDQTVFAIEIPYPQGPKSKIDQLYKYGKVQNPVPVSVLSPYFTYDEKRKCYCRAQMYDGKKKQDVDVPFPTEIKSAEIRKELYKNGFLCNGTRYIRYKRSAGSSRDGQCLFIPEVLFADMMEWSSCGINGNAIPDQASFQAYISLTLSSIMKTVNLSKKAILLVKDQESVFENEAVRVTRTAKNGLDASYGKVKIKNKIWDGEALLDESVFAENGLAGKGMMLLRNRFFKTCAFNTKLQKWFADKGITDISQLNGVYRRGAALSDIKMVITESSLKYCKMMPKDTPLQKVLDTWMDHAFEGNSSDFGLVKTEKPTGIMDGKMVRTNYQLLNTVNLKQDEVSGFLHDSFELLHNVMRDPTYLRYYIQLSAEGEDGDNINQVNAGVDDFRIRTVVEMLKRSDDFVKTKYFCDARGDILTSFKRKIKNGRIPVSGTYATLFGNGAELLQAAVDKNFVVSEPLALCDNEIRTTQFPYGKDLLCARSPHITMGNLFPAKNTDCDVYRTYFNFEEAHEIVCVNSIRYNLMHRLNGCDYDSDTMLITDNTYLLNAAKRDAEFFPVPVGDFEDNDSDAVSYNLNKSDEIATLDLTIAESRIGDIVNLSQFLNSLYWDKIASGKTHEECRELYADICKLAVLSGIEIDKAKRSSKVSTGGVIAELLKRKKDYRKSHGENLPTFFTFMTQGNAKMNDAKLDAPMSRIYDAVEEDSKENRSPKVRKYTPLSSLVALKSGTEKENDSHRKITIIDSVIGMKNLMSGCNIRMRANGQNKVKSEREKMDDEFKKLKKTVADHLTNDHVLAMLLKELDNPKGSRYEISSCYALLFATLVFEDNHLFLRRVIENANPQYDLVYDPSASNPDVYIYGCPHSRVLVQVHEYK